jgi:hypothetical protein
MDRLSRVLHRVLRNDYTITTNIVCCDVAIVKRVMDVFKTYRQRRSILFAAAMAGLAGTIIPI